MPYNINTSFISVIKPKKPIAIAMGFFDSVRRIGIAQYQYINDTAFGVGVPL